MGTFIVLTAANFIYQLAFGQHWSVAVERSLFQGVAIFCVLHANRNLK